MEKGFEFKYKKWVSRVIFAKISLVSFQTAGILILLGKITSSLSKGEFFSAETLGSLLIIIYVMFSSFLSCSIIINFYPKLRICDEGLSVRIFTFRSKWILIPWTEIKEIMRSSRSTQRHEIWIISLNNEISIWNKFLNKFLRWWLIGVNEPAKLISSDLKRKTTFLKTLSEFTNCDTLYE